MKTRYIIGISVAVVIVAILFVGVLSVGMLGSGNDKLMSSLSSMDIGGSAESMAYRGSQIPGSTNQVLPTGDVSDEVDDSGSSFFQDYGVNAFVDASKDSLSTFALDVDSASYTVANSYIMRGELPPKDAIRPEEFVNYLDYSYDAPEDSFAIYPEFVKNPFSNDTATHLLRVGVKAYEPVDERDVVVTFVVDVSGSMNTGERNGLVKKSLRHIIDNLDEDDLVAIVKYNTESSVVIEHTSAANTVELFAAIDTLVPRGSTNIEAGLTTGYDLASKSFNSNAENRVILFSDGVANTGTTSFEDLIDMFEPYKEEGITFSAIGFGLGSYNDELMEQIANNLDGNYAYINGYPEIQRVFGSNLASMMFTVAKDAKIQVDFNPEFVNSYRLVGYENRMLSDDEFEDDSVDAGELGSGHEATAVYELDLTAMVLPYDARIATVSLRYEDVNKETVVETSKDITGSDFVGVFDQASKDAKLAFLSARFAQILKMSQPPPQITMVYEKLDTISLVGEEEIKFKDMVYNAKRLIELAQEN